MYPQELLSSALLPYPSYYGPLPPGAPFLIDHRLIHEYAAATANNEQLKGSKDQNRDFRRIHLRFSCFLSSSWATETGYASQSTSPLSPSIWTLPTGCLRLSDTCFEKIGPRRDGYGSRKWPSLLIDNINLSFLFSLDLGYPNAEYASSVWRATNLSGNPLSKGNHGGNENPSLKLNEMSRHASTRIPSANDRNSR